MAQDSLYLQQSIQRVCVRLVMGIGISFDLLSVEQADGTVCF
jgi:hypothetical protein